MATFPDSGNINDTRSGGKIVTKRRRRPITPYDRPQERPQLRQRSPNLLTDVIFPATRRIASGAAKILSFVFDSDTSDCSSSASSSSSSDSEAAAHGTTTSQLLAFYFFNLILLRVYVRFSIMMLLL